MTQEQTTTMVEAATMDAVEQVLGQQILDRLAKLNASEEGEMNKAFSKIPYTVLACVTKKLGQMGLIRKVKASDGTIFIAKKNITKAQLQYAARRYRLAAEAAAKPRRNMAQPCEVQPDPSNIYDSPQFGLSYEQAVDADPLEAEIPAKSSEIEPTEYTQRMWISPNKRRHIEMQSERGIGRKNAQAAKRRWLKAELSKQATIDMIEEEKAKETFSTDLQDEVGAVAPAHLADPSELVSTLP